MSLQTLNKLYKYLHNHVSYGHVMCRSVDFTHMTLLNVLATPEKNIKIYAKIKKLCNFNHTLIERNFYRNKIAISLDLIKIY